MEEPQPASTLFIRTSDVGSTTRASDALRVEELLRQFDGMGDDEKREALALMFNVDPARAAVVRRPDGSIELKEVSVQARQQIALMASQGFQAASFTNRKERRRTEALARLASKPKPASRR